MLGVDGLFKNLHFVKQIVAMEHGPHCGPLALGLELDHHWPRYPINPTRLEAEGHQ